MTEPATVTVDNGTHRGGHRTGAIRRATRRAIHSTSGYWFAHASGRFDRPDTAWRRAMDYYTSQALVVTGTEAAGRDAHLFRRTLHRIGWGYAHLSGAAEGECYATWDTDLFTPLDPPRAHKLTDLTWTRSAEYGGKKAAKVHALVVPLQQARGRGQYVLVVVHMPLDNTAQRAAVWVDVCRGLVALHAELTQRYPDAEGIVAMDGNKNLRLPGEAGMVRQHLEKPLGLVTSWEHGLPKDGGTLGNGVIDWVLLRLARLAACLLLRDLPDSDHRAFRYRLRRA